MDVHIDGEVPLYLALILYAALVILCGLLSAAGKAMTLTDREDLRRESLPLLSAGQLLLTFAGFFSSGLLTVALAPSLAGALAARGISQGMLLAVLILAILFSTIFLVLARIYPAQIAIRHPDGVAEALAGYSRFFTTLASPFVAVTHGLTNAVLFLTRQRVGIREEGFSEENVMSMVEVGQETGLIKEEAGRMIDSIFAFDDKLAHEIMTPRTDVFAIDINAPASQYTGQLLEMRYSRIPVYDDEPDNIIGILNIKDYMIKASEYGFDDVHIDKILREPFFVPDSKNIDALFLELQKTRQHIAILIDEYGGFTGIVTMEDIIEEIVGDIDDEYDEAEPVIEPINEHTWYVDGGMDLDDVNEATGSELESENNETVGGLLIDIMGEIPDDDEHYDRQVDYGRYRFTILSVRDRRIEGVRMEIREEEPEEASEEAEAQDRKTPEERT